MSDAFPKPPSAPSGISGPRDEQRRELALRAAVDWVQTSKNARPSYDVVIEGAKAFETYLREGR